MKSISIAFICNNINPSVGGTERVTMTISKGLEKYGHKCYYIYSNIDNEKIAVKQKCFLPINAKKEKLFSTLYSFINSNKIQVLFVVNQIYQSRKFQNVFLELKSKTGVKIVGCLHADPANWKKKEKWDLVLPHIYIKSMIKRLLCCFYNKNKIRAVGMYNISDKYILLSERYFPVFKETYHINDIAQKLVAIENPIPFSDNYEGTKKENIVLIVSRMSEIQKRLFYALRIWKRIYQHTEEWQLIFVGGGPQLNTYKKISSKMGLNNVLFIGQTDNVSDYYRKSKIFMMTSIWEGQPMSLIEAVHYACVPIAIDSFASIHDIVQNGKTGVLCKENDIDDYVSKLCSLITNDNEIVKLQTNIINQGLPNFEVTSVLQKWIKLLNELIES